MKYIFYLAICTSIFFSNCSDPLVIDSCEENLEGTYRIVNDRNYELDFEIRYNGNIEYTKVLDQYQTINVSIDIPPGETQKIINLKAGITVNLVDTITICQTSSRIIN